MKSTEQFLFLPDARRPLPRLPSALVSRVAFVGDSKRTVVAT